MPEGAVYVGRPTKWGNPFRIPSAIANGFADSVQEARGVCVRWFENAWDHVEYPSPEEIRHELRGKDLCCWCPLEDADGNPVPCHADVLLEWANREDAAAVRAEEGKEGAVNDYEDWLDAQLDYEEAQQRQEDQRYWHERQQREAWEQEERKWYEEEKKRLVLERVAEEGE